MSTQTSFLRFDLQYKGDACQCGCPPRDNAPQIQNFDHTWTPRNDRLKYLQGVKVTRPLDEMDGPQINEVIGAIKEAYGLVKTYDEMSAEEQFAFRRDKINADAEIKIHDRVVMCHRSFRFDEIVEATRYCPDMINFRQLVKFLGLTRENDQTNFARLWASVLRDCPGQADFNILLDSVKCMVEEYGADVKAQLQKNVSEVTFPILIAVYEQMPYPVIEYLLSKGADPTVVERWSETLPDGTIKERTVDIFELAVTNPNPLVLKFVHRYHRPGINPHWFIGDISYPCPIDNLEVLKELGYDINNCDKEYGPAWLNVFSNVTSHCWNQYLVAKWLVDHGGNLDVKYPSGETFLHKRCKSPECYSENHVKLDELLLTFADWRCRDASQMLPVEYLLDNLSYGRPNFVVSAIIKTGLNNISDTNLPSHMNSGDRRMFACALVYSKYQSLFDLMRTGATMQNEQILFTKLCEAMEEAGGIRLIATLVGDFLQRRIHETCTWLEVLRTFIMSQFKPS